jgi:hypothetical protein
MTYNLSTTFAILLEAIARLDAIAALPDNGEPVSATSMALDFQCCTDGRDLGDLVYAIRDCTVKLVGPVMP